MNEGAGGADVPQHFFILMLCSAGGVMKDNIMVAALNDGGCGNESDLCIPLKLGDGKHTAVTHGGLNLVQ